MKSVTYVFPCHRLLLVLGQLLFLLKGRLTVELRKRDFTLTHWILCHWILLSNLLANCPHTQWTENGTFSEVTSVWGVSAVAILDCSFNVYACGRQKALTMPAYCVAASCNNCRSLNESRGETRNQRSLLRPTSIIFRPFQTYWKLTAPILNQSCATVDNNLETFSPVLSDTTKITNL